MSGPSNSSAADSSRLVLQQPQKPVYQAAKTVLGVEARRLGKTLAKFATILAACIGDALALCGAFVLVWGTIQLAAFSAGTMKMAPPQESSLLLLGNSTFACAYVAEAIATFSYFVSKWVIDLKRKIQAEKQRLTRS